MSPIPLPSLRDVRLHSQLITYLLKKISAEHDAERQRRIMRVHSEREFAWGLCSYFNTQWATSAPNAHCPSRRKWSLKPWESLCSQSLELRVRDHDHLRRS